MGSTGTGSVRFARGRRSRRAPGAGLPHREAADDPGRLPLSLNSLRLACNQTTNRDPVVSYDEPEIREALERLGRRGWTRLASASRADKYRHFFDDAIGVDDAEISVLAVLMLRGPQTPGELKATHRAAASLRRPGRGGCATVEGLVTRELAERGWSAVRPEGGALRATPRARRGGGDTSLDGGHLDGADRADRLAGAREAGCGPRKGEVARLRDALDVLAVAGRRAQPTDP